MSEENAAISARQWPFFPKVQLDRRFDVQVQNLGGACENRHNPFRPQQPKDQTGSSQSY